MQLKILIDGKSMDLYNPNGQNRLIQSGAVADEFELNQRTLVNHFGPKDELNYPRKREAAKQTIFNANSLQFKITTSRGYDNTSFNKDDIFNMMTVLFNDDCVPLLFTKDIVIESSILQKPI